jgi:hypothetical protein
MLASVLVLHGLSLEIADAANRSGFNTRNQVALMDLIWAVRRIAFRHAVEKPQIQRPPKHPVYPDRYRPGDASDNTKRPRKRRRNFQARTTGNGSFDHPIDLEGNDFNPNEGGNAANSSAKRLKAAGGQISRHEVETLPPAGPLNPIHPARFPNLRNRRQGRGRQTAKTTTIYMPPARLQDFPPPRASSVGPIFNSPRPLVVEPGDRTVVELRKVETTLKENMEAIDECSKVMREMYERDERLGVDMVYEELGNLRASFDKCLGEAEEGIKAIRTVVGLIDDKKVDVKTWVDDGT